MGKLKESKTFTVKVQNHGNDGRKTIEIPKEVRAHFTKGCTVKVTMKELE